MGVKRTLQELDINRSTFYVWYKRYQERVYDALVARLPHRRRFWNAIPLDVKKRVVETALEHLDKSPRQLAWHLTDMQGYYISLHDYWSSGKTSYYEFSRSILAA